MFNILKSLNNFIKFLYNVIPLYTIFLTLLYSIILLQKFTSSLIILSPANNIVTKQNNAKIEIFVVVEKEEDLSLYELAQSSLSCYSKIYGYKFTQIILEKNDTLAINCPQKDFMFKRHCITVNYLNQNPDINYLLFIDADMGVINPHHFLEEYINPKFDILFYERIYDSEIVAGSYLLKNTEYARKFIESWANYEPKLPKSFHGTDNAAIHQIFVDNFAPNNSKSRICRKIWDTSKDWEGVFDYVACSRYLLNDKLVFEKVKILSKLSKHRWSRDGWLTNSEWSSADFMFHGWKNSTMNQPGFAEWRNPFISTKTFKFCNFEGKYLLKNWRYKTKFIKTEKEIYQKLKEVENRVKIGYKKRLEKIWKKYMNV